MKPRTQSSPQRRRLLQDLVQRVAIDGIDAASKTTLADELALRVQVLGRPVIRASLDGFHYPRARRYRHGPLSARGYYEVSFDYDALRASLLRPLGPGGERRYRAAVFDHRTNRPVNAPWLTAPAGSLLLFDGVFLLRPELLPYWDASIFVHVTFAAAFRRALRRDRELFGGEAVVEERYRRRYFPAQRHYLTACRPAERATFVIDNSDPADPQWLVRPG